jgi:cellulose synthase/poly-beta-1,6-N-acetylglucosamine synthase-like glycosyltransferase/peptidoglycan/xylan/chitin deacetylase (PgdA/CDA1 family)
LPSPEQVAADRRLRRRLWRPRGHWYLFGLLVAGLAVSLLFQGYAGHDIGRSATFSTDRSPMVGLGGAGPIVDLSGPTVRSVQPPAGEVALTFDDGPDPRWTPRILAVLRRHHVPATFFVIGSGALAHPSLIRDELAVGDVGSHTFTHADLGQASGLRDSFELSLAQAAIGGAGGVETALLRLPYSSGVNQLTVDQYRAARRAARYGYLLVFATRDSEDWMRLGTAFAVGQALPPGRSGGVIMLHDGGGDRSQTVAATERIIDILSARGDRFVTISRMAGLTHAQIDRPISGGSRAQGVALLWIYGFSRVMADVVRWIVVPVLVLTLGRALVAVVLARRQVRRRLPEVTTGLPPVTVVVPAYNEAVGIRRTVESLESSDYPELEIVVVDDGSTDGTAEAVQALGLPRTTVVRQENAGKPAALNTGLARSRHPVVVMLDGDTFFEPDTIRWLVAPMAADPGIGGVSGNTKVGNRRGLLGLWQHIEYVIGFNLDRRMCDELRCIPTVPGAAGAFRRDALAAVGGVSEETLAEDTDLTIAVQRAGWRVVYQDRARAWTEAPSGIGGLWRQRYRWSYGTMQAMWKHRAALRRPGALGRAGLPYMVVFQVLLPLLAPAIDLFALYGLLFLQPWVILAYWLGYNAVQGALGVFAFRLDGERLWPLLTLPLQQILYRQIMYLVVIQSVFSALAGARLRWNKLPRTGLAEVPTG